MNFYILSFKRLNPFWIALGISIFFLLLVDFSIRLYVAGKTSRDQFVDNKESKFIHLSLQNQGNGFDAIFIGSSYTKNHVSTASFEKRGFHVYNLGVSGRTLADFPSMSKAATSRNPRLIVLNISLDELFVSPSSDFLNISDIGPLLSSSSDMNAMVKHVWKFLLSQHTLHYYREPIYETLRSYIARTIASLNDTQHEKSLTKTNYEDLERIKIDCNIFKTAVYDNMKVITCTNGDGIQFGYVNRPSQQKHVHFDITQLNHDAISLLNNVIASSTEKTKVVVVLQPMWDQVVEVDLPVLQALIDAPVLDLTSATFSERDWCDEHHFNIRGRGRYSELLADRLLPYL